MAIGELQIILHQFFSWNKSRLDCLSKIIFAIFVAQTVNLASIANVFAGDAKSLSHYRRVQRFLRWLETFEEDAQAVLQNLILGLLDRNNSKFCLAMDRTNWKFGKAHINFLVVGIWYHGVSIPIIWVSLGKAGTSHTSDRINLIKRLLERIDIDQIEVLTADREFVGEEWFDFLTDNKIPFVIRIKANTMIARPACIKAIPASNLFKRLKKRDVKTLKEQHRIYGVDLFIAASRNKEGELLIVASNWFKKKALKEYMKRWGIETLFGCLKKKGFHVEETHITDKARISALFFILVILTAWSMRVGVNTRKGNSMKVASHGRKRLGYFQRGMRILKRYIIHLDSNLEEFIKYIHLFLPKKSSKATSGGYF